MYFGLIKTTTHTGTTGTFLGVSSLRSEHRSGLDHYSLADDANVMF
jgi:hypothetical protein